jgi:hypothetical protein
MNINELSSMFDLFYAIGELLTTTWLGRIALGMAVGSVLTRIARS